ILTKLYILSSSALRTITTSPTCLTLLVFIISIPMRLPPSSTLFPYTTLFRSVSMWTMTSTETDTTADTTLGAIGGTPTTGTRRTDRKSTRLNSSHVANSHAVLRLKKKKDGKLSHAGGSVRMCLVTDELALLSC